MRPRTCPRKSWFPGVSGAWSTWPPSSGGKDLRGPQAAGILIGKEELIHYALLNMITQEDRTWPLLQGWKRDHIRLVEGARDLRQPGFRRPCEDLRRTRTGHNRCGEAQFGGRRSLASSTPRLPGNVTPRYSWQIDRTKLNITGPEVMQKLADTLANRHRQHGRRCERHAGTQSGRSCHRTITANIMATPATRTASALPSGSSRTARIR